MNTTMGPQLANFGSNHLVNKGSHRLLPTTPPRCPLSPGASALRRSWSCAGADPTRHWSPGRPNETRVQDPNVQDPDIQFLLGIQFVQIKRLWKTFGSWIFRIWLLLLNCVQGRKKWTPGNCCAIFFGRTLQLLKTCGKGCWQKCPSTAARYMLAASVPYVYNRMHKNTGIYVYIYT